MSCTIGSYVQYAILVRRASDIMAGIAFAKARNIRLVIRNTAHDYLGKSTGSLALAIWTHHLKDIQFLDFKSNYYYGKAVKLGAGVQFSEVYQTAKARGLVVVGGNCLTVGIAGGYSQGGGHGMLASRYGLAADQVLRWDVVTAEGKLLVATPLQNADLYWALCGGGGGTYGVVVSLTVRVYPDKRTSASNFAFTNEGVDQDTYYAAVSAYIKNSLTIADAGSVASFLLTNTSFTVAPITGYGLTKADLDRFVLPTVNVLNQYKMNYSGSRLGFQLDTKCT
jgi:FAD/FMN-containing dehydrogenase